METLVRPVCEARLFVVQEDAAVFDARGGVGAGLEGEGGVLLCGDVGPPVKRG